MQNEYNAAEAVEIGKAEDVILGEKLELAGIDFPGNEPPDRQYVD